MRVTKWLVSTDLFQSVSNLSGGKVHHRCIQQLHSVPAQGNLIAGTWTGIDQKIEVIEQILVVFPLCEHVEVVPSDEQEEGPVRVVGYDLLKRLNGIGGKGQAELDVGGNASRMAHNRVAYAIQPFQSIFSVCRRFQRILRTYHEPDFLCQTLLYDKVCQHQVTFVNRMEGATQKGCSYGP